ncbi:uncharacterized protein LOC143453536 [Clavelina lepadiformis]|uniref:uncharacterized protein LOC143453536 n=1 Tax=Clavelina lepadiformis TaxID=159417 RepID=UPI004041FD56
MLESIALLYCNRFIIANPLSKQFVSLKLLVHLCFCSQLCTDASRFVLGYLSMMSSSDSDLHCCSVCKNTCSADEQPSKQNHRTHFCRKKHESSEQKQVKRKLNVSSSLWKNHHSNRNVRTPNSMKSFTDSVQSSQVCQDSLSTYLESLGHRSSKRILLLLRNLEYFWPPYKFGEDLNHRLHNAIFGRSRTNYVHWFQKWITGKNYQPHLHDNVNFLSLLESSFKRKSILQQSTLRMLQLKTGLSKSAITLWFRWKRTMENPMKPILQAMFAKDHYLSHREMQQIAKSNGWGTSQVKSWFRVARALANIFDESKADKEELILWRMFQRCRNGVSNSDVELMSHLLSMAKTDVYKIFHSWCLYYNVEDLMTAPESSRFEDLEKLSSEGGVDTWSRSDHMECLTSSSRLASSVPTSMSAVSTDVVVEKVQTSIQQPRCNSAGKESSFHGVATTSTNLMEAELQKCGASSGTTCAENPSTTRESAPQRILTPSAENEEFLDDSSDDLSDKELVIVEDDDSNFDESEELHDSNKRSFVETVTGSPPIRLVSPSRPSLLNRLSDWWFPSDDVNQIEKVSSAEIYSHDFVVKALRRLRRKQRKKGIPTKAMLLESYQPKRSKSRLVHSMKVNTVVDKYDLLVAKDQVSYQPFSRNTDVDNEVVYLGTTYNSTSTQCSAEPLIRELQKHPENTNFTIATLNSTLMEEAPTSSEPISAEEALFNLLENDTDSSDDLYSNNEDEPISNEASGVLSPQVDHTSTSELEE